jgi:hypothetical protein
MEALVTRLRVIALMFAVCPLFASGAARGQTSGKLNLRQQYEEDLINRAFTQLQLTREPVPLGKRVEKIIVITNDVFVKGVDPIPTFFNVFHVTTRAYIVEQELLFKLGDWIGPDTLAESERNLRGFFVLSMARIVAAKGSTPDQVIAVVITKDLWSLRPNFAFAAEGNSATGVGYGAAIGGGIGLPLGGLGGALVLGAIGAGLGGVLGAPHVDLLSFVFAEHNLAGRNKFLGLTLRLDPATIALGEHFTDARILGSRVTADESFTVIFNRDTGDAEGIVGAFSVSRPLFSLASKWAWSAGVAVADDVARQFRNGATIEQFSYDERLITSYVEVRRQLGTRLKHQLALGYKVVSNDFTAHEETDPNVLPFSESYGQVYFNYNMFQPRFMTFRNMQTFALTEDYRLGPGVSLGAGLAASELGFSSDFFASSAELFWRFLLPGRDLLTFDFTGGARYQPHLNSPQMWQTKWVNRYLSGGIDNISPTFYGMHIFSHIGATLHDYDLTNTILQLGNYSGLRGFPNGTFSGSNAYIMNLELRTLPIAVYTLHVGLVAFYDGGSAFFSPGGPHLESVGGMQLPAGYHQNVGFGIRGLLPQFSHVVLRGDIGFPIFESDPGISRVAVSVAFGQGF